MRPAIDDIQACGETLRVLSVTAHPDDVDFGAAGTMALWRERGAEITYLITTSGEEGMFDAAAAADIPAIRRREQIAAAAAVGVEDVRFLDGYRDGSVTVVPDLVRDISRVIRQVRPHVVVTMSPERDWSDVFQGHPDHLAVGEATTRAVYPASRNPYAFPELLRHEGLQEWIVSELWFINHPDADTFVEIASSIDRKVDAVAAHASQHHDPEHVRERLLQSHESMRRPQEDVFEGPVERFLRVDTHEDRELRILPIGA